MAKILTKKPKKQGKEGWKPNIKIFKNGGNT